MSGPGDGAAGGELLSAPRIRALAEELGVHPTKQWGQNFVVDPNTIRRIVGLAELDGSEHVLEVGPGLGSLTLGLLDEAAQVTAVEIDPRLAARLPETMEQMRPAGAGRLRVIHQDAMTLGTDRADGRRVGGSGSGGEALAGGDDAALGAPDVLVANLPYNVAVPVVLHLLQVLPSLTKGLVMVQDEVADRLCAGPGSKIYGVPSVKAAWDTLMRKAGVVGTRVFWPEPRISSGLVRFDRRDPASETVSRQEVFAVVDAAFAQRRKTLRAALSSLAGSGADAEEVLRAAGVDPRARGETLEVGAYTRIAEALRDRGDAEDEAGSDADAENGTGPETSAP